MFSDLAQQQYIKASKVFEESDKAWCNAAAVGLLMQQLARAASLRRPLPHQRSPTDALRTPDSYDYARIFGQNAVAACERRANAVQGFAATRAAVITALETSHFATPPAALKPSRTSAEQKAERLIHWKSLTRLAKAHSAIARHAMKTHGDTDVEARQEAQENCATAATCESLWSCSHERPISLNSFASYAVYKKAYSMNPSEELPKKERGALYDELKACEARWHELDVASKDP